MLALSCPQYLFIDYPYPTLAWIKATIATMLNSAALGLLFPQEAGVGPGVCISNQPTTPLQIQMQDVQGS